MNNNLVPPEQIRNRVMTARDEEHYFESGKAAFQTLVANGMSPTDRILDLGCGCGRLAIHIGPWLAPGSEYHGVDCVDELLDWCKEEIEPVFPNCRFHFADLLVGGHNPEGTILASDYVFPFADNTFTFVLAISLFTHMLPEGAANYLAEISRVLQPGGRFWSQYFLLNDQSRQGISRGTAHFNFKYEVGNSLCLDEAVPEIAIAHPEEELLGLYEKHDLETLRLVHGNWPHEEPKETSAFQDIVLSIKR